MIFCGKTVAQGPLLPAVQAAAGERCVGVFAGVRSHSPRPDVEAGAAVLKRLLADAVIALGGGSATVTARAATIFQAEGRTLSALATSRDATGRMHSPRLSEPKLAQFVVPTTPNTATVKAGSAVFDPEAGRRFAMFDPKTRAQTVFVQPDALMSAPRDLVRNATLDTLTLALEGLCAPGGDPFADAQLMHAIRLIVLHLGRFAADDGPKLRTGLTMAAILAGRGTDHTGAGVATVLGHAIGAVLGIDNGLAKAVVLPEAIRFNADHAGDDLAKVAVAMGLAQDHPGEHTALALSTLFGGLGVPPRLRDLAVPRGALEEIARHGMDDWFLAGNPRPVRDAEQLEALLERCW